MLEGRHHEDVLVALEDVLGAVAVVDVEVDDHHALQAVRLDGVARRDRDVVEDAEPHGARAARVVPRGADGAERRLRLVFHYEIDCKHRRASGAQRGVQGVRVHRRVRVEVHGAGLRRHFADRPHVLHRMHPRELLVGGERRFEPGQDRIEPRGDELVLDRREPLRPLGMMASHLVLEAIGMRYEGGGHGNFIL
jgi:hypothetical protein